MRVVCRTIEDFLSNLQIGELVEKTVWIDSAKRPINESKTLLNLQATAVVRMKDGGEFLLQYGEDCGFDYADGEPELKGTEALNHRKGFLVERCEDMGLSVKPGIVGV